MWSPGRAQVQVTPRGSDGSCTGRISNTCTNPVAGKCLRSLTLGRVPRGSHRVDHQGQVHGTAGNGDPRNKSLGTHSPWGVYSCLSSIFSDHNPSCCFVAPFPRPVPYMQVTFRLLPYAVFALHLLSLCTVISPHRFNDRPHADNSPEPHVSPAILAQLHDQLSLEHLHLNVTKELQSQLA